MMIRCARQLIPTCAIGLLLYVGAVAADGRDGSGDVSVLEIPLRFDLQPLFQAAEEALPQQAGHWRGWQRSHGIDSRYRAWRGPLQLWMQGPVLQATAHVRYWAQARKHIIGSLDLSASCGVKEPPRQAVVGLLARLDWAPDWTLHPSFRVLPTRFIDRCEVTVADIDVSPLVDRMFDKRLRQSLQDAMRTIRPELSGLREQAARAWQALQRPHRIGPGVWLAIQPVGVALAPPRGQGNQLESALLLAFRAAIHGEQAPRAGDLPLPPLRPFLPGGTGMRLDLTLDLDYGGLGRQLAETVSGKVLGVEQLRISVDALEIFPRGEDLVLVLRLGGDATGRLEIMGRPGFDAGSGKVTLADLDFIFDSDDPEQTLLVDLFYERARVMLEQTVDRLLEEHGASLRGGVRDALEQILPDGTEIDLSELHPTDVTMTVLPDGLRLKGTAAGHARVSPR